MIHIKKSYEQVGLMAVKSVPLFPMALDSATPARKGLNFFRAIRIAVKSLNSIGNIENQNSI